MQISVHDIGFVTATMTVEIQSRFRFLRAFNAQCFLTCIPDFIILADDEVPTAVYDMAAYKTIQCLISICDIEARLQGSTSV